ncbi:hypothetical protein H0G86_009749 [Trichoderma simmonsii]|uniref:Fungal-specific transcription factor domain-containing protein n=2 Tax=Trichoderma simmonsii TaxID=1491479 RepID=A0A8G0LMH0_9HYPO|nr:hypothetical protein H0G86_009749 [Trichoderma simmonsii]
MDATPDHQPIEFASIILGQPLDSTQSLIYSQSKIRIRQHAMRASSRAKAIALSGDQTPIAPVLQPQSMLTGKFRSRPYTQIRKARQPRFISKIQDVGSKESAASATGKTCIPRALDAGKSDPFHTLPIKIGPLQEHLLKLIPMTFYMQNPLVLNPEYSPLPYAFADAALLHALFALTSLYRDLSVGTKVTPLCLMHKGEMLRIINERITKTPLQLSDGTIGAVTALATFDLLDGRLQNARWNLRGLQRMVVQRGGLQIVGKEAQQVCGTSLLQRAICWSDLCSAAFTNEKPRFAVLRHSSSPLSRPYVQDNSLFSSIGSIFDMLSELSLALCDSHNSFSRRLSFSNNLYLVEHALHSLPQDIYSCYHEPKRIAAIIYVYLLLRQIPSSAGIYQPLLGRLHAAVGQSIERNSEDFSSHPSNLFLLWICFIGAATSGPPNKIECLQEWWINLLRNICKGLNVVSEIGFEVYLNRVVEMGSLCREMCHTVWREIDSSEPYNGENGSL